MSTAKLVPETWELTYGPLAGIVALQIWSLLSCIALLFGGALGAQLEAVRAGTAAPNNR